jgi:hypothetical protein
MIALTPGTDLQVRVSKALQARGYRTVEAVIG